MPKKTGPKATASESPVDDLTYEAAVEELESIIERIESGEIGLEDSISFYERGTKLLRRCRAVLGQAEQRIERLDADALADPATEPDSGDNPA
ncbi:MAG: exodeoxyribonuclease VII small subunit [Phycisphaeraceae bacterium]|nr:MAG: exodeoxyribonuclease VII small subunit [Phycisphaeraceae bacterium]